MLIIQEKQHILIGGQLKVQLNISECGRTFEDIPFRFVVPVGCFLVAFKFIYLFNDSTSKFHVSFR